MHIAGLTLICLSSPVNSSATDQWKTTLPQMLVMYMPSGFPEIIFLHREKGSSEVPIDPCVHLWGLLLYPSSPFASTPSDSNISTHKP
ncbi:hypothetical protein VNO77_35111 [Canavalia gladiata]|uniref:Secreted protein n=1 Tax=Canavalia gladiata TaxID=3824 RepID=A0AAN9KH63_CANGL